MTTGPIDRTPGTPGSDKKVGNPNKANRTSLASDALILAVSEVQDPEVPEVVLQDLEAVLNIVRTTSGCKSSSQSKM